MAAAPEDEAREERITYEIVVDAYDGGEQAMGWHAYLQGKLHFPFAARCLKKRASSPLRPGDEAQVIAMAEPEDCEREMLVAIAWGGDELAVPLEQLEAVNVDDETQQAVEDWRYWLDRGYSF